MLIISLLYGLLVYLLFFKFRILPWNTISKYAVVLIGVIILSGFLVGLQGLTPSSTQATITGRLAEIAPEVTGRITSVSVEPNVILERRRRPVRNRSDDLPGSGRRIEFTVWSWRGCA